MVVDRRLGESEETEVGEEEGVEAGAGTESRRRWKVLLDEMRWDTLNE